MIYKVISFPTHPFTINDPVITTFTSERNNFQWYVTHFDKEADCYYGYIAHKGRWAWFKKVEIELWRCPSTGFQLFERPSTTKNPIYYHLETLVHLMT